MKYIKTLSAVLLFLGILQVKAQKNNETTTKTQALDNPPKCTNIKEGKFLRPNYPEEIWYMTVKDNVQTEYFNNGKNFIKSTLVFIDDCNYKQIVLETSEKNSRIKVGDVFNNKIIATQNQYLKIQSKIENRQFDLVFIKAK